MGVSQVFSTTIVAAGTDAVFNLGTAGFDRAYFARGTMTTAAEFWIYGSADGSTYHRVVGQPANTATTAPIPFIISSANTGNMVQFPVVGQWMKFVATGAACSAVDIKLFCHQY